MTLISTSKIKKHLVVLNKWSYENNSLCRQYKFQSYMDGINFVMELAKLSEKHNHHPDIVIGWCTVEVKFTSHDKGGVSEKCLELSKLSDELLKEHNETS